MKILCPNCKEANTLQQKECFNCQSELKTSFDWQFQTDNGQIISFLDFFSKIEQLETRLTFVETNYERKYIEQIQEVVVPKPKLEPEIENIVPQELPDTLQELEALLVIKERAQGIAYQILDMTLHAKLTTECRRIEEKIQQLKDLAKAQEEKSPELVVDTQNENPTVLERLEAYLQNILARKEEANKNNDLETLGFLLRKEEEIKKEITIFKLTGEVKEELIEEENVQKQPAVLVKEIQQVKTEVKKVKVVPQGPDAFEQFFAPLSNGLAFVGQRYNQYKEEGKLPLFFLTIAGIVTLLFGFGFLAQYSAVTYFGDYLTQIKVGFGFICSAALIGIGVKLIGKKADFASFGEALIGLGLSLNYLFIYFLSAEPALIGSTVGFVLIFINTAISVGASLQFKSKIIASLALLGGAFAPSYLQSTGENTHIYFLYLWVLCAASAFVAHRIKWEFLNFISFLVTTLILGGSVYFSYTSVRSLSDNLYLLLFHVFGYLYAYVSLFDGLKPKKEQSSTSVITLVGAQVAMMMSLYYVFGLQQGSYQQLAIAYVLNALPFAAITLVYRSSWSERQKALLIGVLGSFLAAAIAAYVGAVYRGVLWALEGIVLLAGGLIFRLALVRRIAYLIIIMGIINMLANLGWNDMPNRLVGILFTAGYINLWSLGLVLLTISVLFKKYDESLEHHEKSVPFVFNELIAVWGLSIFYISSYFFFGRYAYNLAIIPMVVLLLWNNYRKLQIAEILGLGQFLVLLGAMISSMVDAQTLQFSQQALYGQLAMIEILVVLWGLKLFYEKVLPNTSEGRLYLLGKMREIAYFILPIALIDSFNNELPDYILYGLWLAVLLAFILFEITASKLVLVELLLVAIVAMGYSFIKIEYIALLLGNSILLGILFYKKAWLEEVFEQKDYQPIYLTAPYFAIASVGLVFFKATGEDYISALFIVAALILTMVNLAHQLAPIKRTMETAYRLAWLLTVFALALLYHNIELDTLKQTTGISFIFLLITLGWSHKMIYKADVPYNGNQQSPTWIGESVFLHLLNIMSYSVLLFFITKDFGSLYLTIAFFIHGIALVFNGLLPNYKHLSKIYIVIFVIALVKLFFIDMKDAETIMKIIVFIVVGIICLVAAFALIKYNDKNKKVVAVEDKEE